METSADRIKQVQTLLKELAVPGWLFYDFRGSDPMAYSVLELNPQDHVTRRWFYFVPAEGTPQKLVHRIEAGKLESLPGTTRIYLAWQELEGHLREILARLPTVAMQYSPRNAIPYVSAVDAGTIEMIRSLGPKVLSSADLLQYFDSRWTGEQVETHIKSARLITQIVQEAYAFAGEEISEKGQTTELSVQSFIMKRFEEENLETDFPPIVAVNENSGNPHYAPSEDSRGRITKGDFLLIDLWAKERVPGAVFADITWTGLFGRQPSEKIQLIYDTVVAARDAGLQLLKQRFSEGTLAEGWEIDDATRSVITSAGYGDFFIHRTGHNLGFDVHGHGVCFDNLETHDTRKVISGIGCTIEPGIYLPDFGVRSEIDIYMSEDGPVVTTPPQESLLVIDV